MKEFKLLITGGSTFTSEHIFSKTIDVLTKTLFKNVKLSFVTAMAPGADAMAYLYAHIHGIKVYEYHPNRKDGADAQWKMKNAMADFADGALIFCQETKEAEHIAAYMMAQQKKVAVIEYKE